MYYLTLDKDGYLAGYTVLDREDGIETDMPAVESLDEGMMADPCCMLAHRWDGEKLVLDEDKLARLRAEQAKAERITELKERLAATDYAVIKIAEGSALTREYADVIARRQAWREEINALEGAI